MEGGRGGKVKEEKKEEVEGDKAEDEEETDCGAYEAVTLAQ